MEVAAQSLSAQSKKQTMEGIFWWAIQTLTEVDTMMLIY